MRYLVGLFLGVCIVGGGIVWYSQLDEYFVVEGKVDADVERCEAQILPYGKWFPLSLRQGRFSIKMNEEEAHKMNAIRFDFYSKRNKVIQYEMMANHTIVKMHVTCKDERSGAAGGKRENPAADARQVKGGFLFRRRIWGGVVWCVSGAMDFPRRCAAL